MPETIADQLARARRARILDAAIAEFSSKGFHRTTIRDVARRAGVADGTIYNYFAGKAALLIGILDRLNESERRDADLAQSAGLDLRTFMRGYFRQRLAVFDEGALDVMRVLLPEVLTDPELRARYAEQVLAPTFAVAERHTGRWPGGDREPPLDMPLALRAIAGMFLGLVLLRLLGDGEVTERWNELPDLLTTLVLDGLTPGGGHDHDR